MPFNNDDIRRRPVFKVNAIDDQEKFKPLPPPKGKYPYRLKPDLLNQDMDVQRMVFQTCGDTGGIMLPTYQHQVVAAMTKQFSVTDDRQENPLFFMHLGDLVYNYGQEHEYEPQFFLPFKDYPAPIFAIAGNHDGDVDPLDPLKPESLDAFLKVFCTREAYVIPFSGNTNFKSSIQPNVYWTLETPLANLICLYSNVPRFGTITAEQRAWFIEELKNAGTQQNERALIVCLHHSAYSADINHGSSMHMQQFLNACFEEANTWPALILSGHVHNYQRFHKYYNNGKVVPFVIAGAGGYAQLHPIATLNDPAFPDDSALLDDVRLESYCDTAHGFLRIAITRNNNEFNLKGEYFVIAENEVPLIDGGLYDSFTIDL